MNNLLKGLASAFGFFVAALIPVACSSVEDDKEPEPDFDIKGKVFVNSYEEEDKDVHVAGTEILEFKTSDSVVRYNLFCILAGDYLRLYDYEERGRYGVLENAVMIGLGDSLTTAKIYINSENMPVLNWPGLGEYEYSKLSVEGNKKRFERVHKHNVVDPVVKPGDSILVVDKGNRYLVCHDRKSFILNVDSVSGSHADNNQYVSFTITGIPGEFSFSEAKGNMYLMKFGSMAYAPVNKELAESNPKDIVLVLLHNDKVQNYTIASPSEVEEFTYENHSKIAKLKPQLY